MTVDVRALARKIADTLDIGDCEDLLEFIRSQDADLGVLESLLDEALETLTVDPVD